MLPQPARAVALAVAMALLLVLPSVLAQSGDPVQVSGGPDTGTPPTVQDPPRVGSYPPDLYPTGFTLNASDETQVTQICVQITDIAPLPPPREQATYVENPAGPFSTRLDIYAWDGTNWTLDQQPEARHTGQMSNTVNQRASMCFDLHLRSAYYLVNTLVDSNNEIDESNETNNARPSYEYFAVEIAPRAELEFLKLDVSPSPAPSGRTIGFVAYITNTGEVASNATVVDIIDGTLVIARLPIPRILVSQTVSVQTAVAADDLRPGDHTASFFIDPIRNVSEYSRRNNLVTKAFYVLQHPAPDLIVSNLSYDGTLLARRGLTLHARVLNVGNLTSAPSIARLYVDDVPVQNATLTRLRPLEPTIADFFLVPPEGNHTLRVVADAEDVVSESNETNNDKTINITVLPPPTVNATPNLVVERLGAAPNDPAPGELVSVTAIVQNLGDKTSNVTTLQLYANGVAIGRAPVPRVAADRRVSVTYSWTPPPPGTYTLRALVDPDNLVDEVDEVDNNATLYTQIFPPGGAAVQLPDTNVTPPDEPNVTLPPPPTTFPDLPTPTTNSTGNATAPIEITSMTLSTRQVPGGVKGIIVITIRNPAFSPVGRMTVTYRVDGESIKEILVAGLASAATTTASSSDIDIPAGTHLASAEVRIVGGTGVAANATKSYTADAGAKAGFLGVPAPAVGVLMIAIAASAIVLRRKTRT